MKKIISFIRKNAFEIIMGFMVFLVVVTFFIPLFIAIGIAMWGDVIGALQM